MNQLDRVVEIDLAAQPRDVDVDHVVERRRARGFLPDIARQRLARHDLPLIPQQILEQLEFADGELDRLAAPAITLRVTRSISRSPTASRGASATRPRRTSARMRASSSANANGLTR